MKCFRFAFAKAIIFFCIHPLWAQTVAGTYQIDFGSADLDKGTIGNANNISRSFNAGSVDEVRLLDTDGNQSNIVLKITDDFRGRNEAGTTSPDHTLGFSRTEGMDNFFGNTQTFNGAINATGGFSLTGLQPNRLYSFRIFASRMNVSDNRETAYMFSGLQNQTVYLDPANNTDQAIDVLNVKPDASGSITIDLTAGPNNTNPNGFFYISAMTMLDHDTTLNSFSLSPSLELTYPVIPVTWEVGKTVTLNWESMGQDLVDILYSEDNGSTWQTIATVEGALEQYDWQVPVNTSDMLIELRSSTLSSTSQPISIIPDEGIFYDIYVLGSSTAAGSGPSHPVNTWVNKYKRYLYGLDTRYRVENLALGGQVTYNLLPTGTSIPAGVNETINVQRNITKALMEQADGVIINLPSNDAARGYTVNQQTTNYDLIIAEATTDQVPVWLTTPQPRNFGNNSNGLNIQLALLNATWASYGPQTVDFWTGFPVSGDNGILPEFDSGDGVHMNNAAHQIMFERMFAKDIHLTVKNQVDAALDSPAFAKANITIFPNPVLDKLYIHSETPVDSKLYNLQGQRVLTDKHNNYIDCSSLPAGIYLLKIDGYGVHRIVKR